MANLHSPGLCKVGHTPPQSHRAPPPCSRARLDKMDALGVQPSLLPDPRAAAAPPRDSRRFAAPPGRHLGSATFRRRQAGPGQRGARGRRGFSPLRGAGVSRTLKQGHASRALVKPLPSATPPRRGRAQATRKPRPGARRGPRPGTHAMA